MSTVEEQCHGSVAALASPLVMAVRRGKFVATTANQMSPKIKTKLSKFAGIYKSRNEL
jgi:hypothetical protein